MCVCAEGGSRRKLKTGKRKIGKLLLLLLLAHAKDISATIGRFCEQVWCVVYRRTTDSLQKQPVAVRARDTSAQKINIRKFILIYLKRVQSRVEERSGKRSSNVAPFLEFCCEENFATLGVTRGSLERVTPEERGENDKSFQRARTYMCGGGLFPNSLKVARNQMISA